MPALHLHNASFCHLFASPALEHITFCLPALPYYSAPPFFCLLLFSSFSWNKFLEHGLSFLFLDFLYLLLRSACSPRSLHTSGRVHLEVSLLHFSPLCLFSLGIFFRSAHSFLLLHSPATSLLSLFCLEPGCTLFCLGLFFSFLSFSGSALLHIYILSLLPFVSRLPFLLPALVPAAPFHSHWVGVISLPTWRRYISLGILSLFLCLHGGLCSPGYTHCTWRISLLCTFLSFTVSAGLCLSFWVSRAGGVPGGFLSFTGRTAAFCLGWDAVPAHCLSGFHACTGFLPLWKESHILLSVLPTHSAPGCCTTMILFFLLSACLSGGFSLYRFCVLCTPLECTAFLDFVSACWVSGFYHFTCLPFSFLGPAVLLEIFAWRISFPLDTTGFSLGGVSHLCTALSAGFLLWRVSRLHCSHYSPAVPARWVSGIFCLGGGVCFFLWVGLVSVLWISFCLLIVFSLS